MNVLILTPDAVGSTLLQRLITIYMQFHHYDRPVINLHELTNGLVRYHNDTFNLDVLGKQDGAWGYHQSLKQIVELLDSVDHYKTSRLAQYHINLRKDPLEDQISFYQYLNENFYIISCRRHNIFEHALSWCLNKVTKKINVYNSKEKIETFFDLYNNGIILDPNSLLNTLNDYKNYITWCNDHFDVANYFFYEEHLPEIEKYILSLPIFSQQKKLLTWNDSFDMSFNTWNICHYLSSDLGTLALDQPTKFAQLTDQYLTQLEHADTTQQCEHDSNLATREKLPQSITEYLPAEFQEFVRKNQHTYQKGMYSINEMQKKGILVSPPPIKKQTLAEKKHIIKNYQNLLLVYNQWIELNPQLGCPLDNDILDKFADIERSRWNPTATAISVSGPPTNY